MDANLLAEFISESRDHLDGIEPDLMALDGVASGERNETVNRVFRAIHSIKGGAGFLAFDNLKRLSHAMENILMEVREGRFQPDEAAIDVLLRGVDKLRAMLDDIQASDNIPIDEELAALADHIGHGAAQKSGVLCGNAEAPTPHETTLALLSEEVLRSFGLSADELRSRHSDARYLFRIEVKEETDLRPRNLSKEAWVQTINPLGDILALVSDGSPEGSEKLVLLFSSVLEPDLAVLALELPEHQVQLATLDDSTTPGVRVAPMAQTIPRDAIGGILIEKFGLNTDDVIAAARLQGEGDPRQLGAILLAAGCVTRENLVEALKLQEQLRKPTAIPVHRAGGDVAPPPAERTAPPAASPESIRVRVDVLTRLMNSTGELVLARNQILRALDTARTQHAGLSEMLQNLDQVTSELQDGVMQTRVQAIGLVFGRFTRLVRDVARSLGKSIELHTYGSDVELDKTIVEALADPLTHLVRNSADHGIELPEDRIAAGKPSQGNITLNAFHEGGQVHITIADDGRGLDPRKILAKAIERGIISHEQARSMQPQEVNSLIFAPGFSTADQVTDLSGRGVGMDVVRTNIEKLGGVVGIESELGRGTTISLQLPLTLAIIQSFVAGAGGHRFAIPQVNVEEFVWVKAADVHARIEHYHGNDVLRLRGRLLPLVHLGRLLQLPALLHSEADGEPMADRRERVADRRGIAQVTESAVESVRGPDRRRNWHSDYNIVVVRAGKNCFGLIVDQLHDMEEIVVKPLSTFLQGCRSFSGATILGDGEVILILDLLGLSHLAKLNFADLASAELRQREEERRREAEHDRLRQSVILLRAGADEQFAMPQELVSRLEQVYTSKIQRMGDREYIDYRGSALPLIRLDQCLPVHPLPTAAEILFLVIPKNARDPQFPPNAGILVSEVCDACDVIVELNHDTGFGPGVRGSALIHNRITYFIEPQALLATVGLADGVTL